MLAAVLELHSILCPNPRELAHSPFAGEACARVGYRRRNPARVAVVDALTDLGYSSSEVAASVTEAIESAERQCPDLIIADHRIIDGTGTAAVQAICCDKAIPVVFVTSSEGEVREQLPDALIVPKPFSIAELQAAIGLALKRPFQHEGS